MIKAKTILIVMALIVINLFCKPKQVLPDRTEEGLNTFGVKIDGKVWVPTGSFNILGSSKLQSQYDNSTGVLGITAQKATNKEVLQLTVTNVFLPGRYAFNTDIHQASITEYRGIDIDDNYVAYPGATNNVSITKLDTIKKIISGTFEIQLKGRQSNAIKNFTHGIFDVSYEK